MKVQRIMGILSRIAPGRIAYDWDNCGIQVGDLNGEVERVMVTLDITEEVIDEAIDCEAGMIVSHHPLIFKGLKSIHSGTETGRIIFKAIKNNIAIYSAHTNLDIVAGGLNDYLAAKFDLKEVRSLDIVDTDNSYKLIVYVPEEHVENVKNAIFKAGAGCIGNYSHTSFSIEGEGTFKPLAGSAPFEGSQGEMSRVREKRVETVVPANKLNKIIAKMINSHPYEEPAYDIYRLENMKQKYGIGRIGLLEKEIEPDLFLKMIKNRLDKKFIKYTRLPEEKIEKVALCTGAGGDYINKAAVKGADIYITGDIKYHQAQQAKEAGLCLIAAGHYNTEIYAKELLEKRLMEEIKKSNDKKSNKMKIIKSRVKTNPWKVFD